MKEVEEGEVADALAPTIPTTRAVIDSLIPVVCERLPVDGCVSRRCWARVGIVTLKGVNLSQMVVKLISLKVYFQVDGERVNSGLGANWGG